MLNARDVPNGESTVRALRLVGLGLPAKPRRDTEMFVTFDTLTWFREKLAISRLSGRFQTAPGWRAVEFDGRRGVDSDLDSVIDRRRRVRCWC